jgi:DNA-binding IclR family transcriptional regulator
MEDPIFGDMAGEPPESSIKSLDSAFAIVTALGERREAGVTELAAATGLAKSSVYKHLQTLAAHEFVVKGEEGYRLGLRFLDLGGGVRSRTPGASLVKPKLRELAERAGETAQYAVAEHGRTVVLYREVSARGVFSKGRVGRRFAMNQTAAGKAILSGYPDELVEAVVERHGLPASTPHTVADADALFEELDRIRERGVAFNDEGSTEGLRSVAVPVTGPEGDVLGAFAVAGPTHRVRGETFETELPDLTRSVVNELELNLAYS